MADDALTLSEPVQLYASDEAAVYHSRWQDLARIVDRCDALIVDAPYSERTHKGHDNGSNSANRGVDWAARQGDNATAERRWKVKHAQAGNLPEERKVLSYQPWSPDDVEEFVSAWSQRCSGWFVSITDHVLAPAWEAALQRQGRYVFAPLACVEPGSRVRLTGDGPSQWSCWAIVARPSTAEAARWRALPGAYVAPPGHGDSARRGNGGVRVSGGKPLWLMERLVEDYSRPGQLVVDPCAGAFTTMIAALRTGRRFIGGDQMLAHAELGAKALRGAIQRPLFLEGA